MNLFCCRERRRFQQPYFSKFDKKYCLKILKIEDFRKLKECFILVIFYYSVQFATQNNNINKGNTELKKQKSKKIDNVI